MARKKLSYKEIMKLAEDYGVADNVLFVSASERYIGQVEMIRKIQADLEENGLIFEVIGSTGQKKIEAHPMAAQLPKYNDTANKTLGVMLDIIARLGTSAPVGDKLSEFLNG